MSTNYEILCQKFNNFKLFVREHAKSPKVQLFATYTDEQFLQFSCILLGFKKDGKIEELAKKTCDDLEIDPQHQQKIARYFECFTQYLLLMNDPIIPKDESKKE